MYLDELGMLSKIKTFKVLFRKMSGLQKWTSICRASLGIIRLDQELTSGQHRKYDNILSQAHTGQMSHADDIAQGPIKELFQKLSKDTC